jgi:hypothetical protein
MEPVFLVKTSAVLLGLTALGGLLMGLLRFRMERPPAWLAMAHGFLAASGLTLLLYTGITVGVPNLMWFGIAILLLAAPLGIYLNLAYHAKLRALPALPILIHGVVAAAGFAIVALGATGAWSNG